METELKPCPFCGGRACINKRLKWWSNSGHADRYEYGVTCTSPFCIAIPSIFKTEEEAIEKWNKRKGEQA